MPVIETNFSTAGPVEKELHDELVKELKDPRQTGQPIVEIRQMSRDAIRHVHVIWDKWAGCPPETRAAIIRDAFSEVKGAAYEKSIAITVAATTPEAVEAGLLPYEVKPLHWSKFDSAYREQAREALVKEGASTLGDTWLPILAFATPKQADEAVERLKKSAGQFEWGTVVTRMIPF